MIDRLYVDKAEGGFGDALMAYGLAIITQDIAGLLSDGSPATVILLDKGPYYQLQVDPAIDAERLPELRAYAPDAPIIRTAKNAMSFPESIPAMAYVDYEYERDKRAEFFEMRRNLSDEARKALNQELDHPELTGIRGLIPHEHWDIFRALNPGALSGYNKLVTQWWGIQPMLSDVLYLLFDAYAQLPFDVDAIVKSWNQLKKQYGLNISATVTSLQVFNPAQGKGQNKPKANKLVMDNIKGSFWLCEWLKAVGFYCAALTKQPFGTKDRKTYVLRPVKISNRDSADVMRLFRKAMVISQSAVKSDVMAALEYTKALLAHSQKPEAAGFAQLLFATAVPSWIVAGFYSAFYKNLGNSAATMNLSFMGLPGWVRVRNVSEAEEMSELLEEHKRIIQQFDESHSDDVNLLLAYRDFVSSNDIWPFFKFTRAYASYIISQREKTGGRARQLTESNLRRLIMSAAPKLSKIIESEGFQNVAYAIRQSTVVAQYRKSQGDRRYDVRYGLNQELARKANYADDFLSALGDFMHKYNAENAQVMENRAGPYRKSLKTSDVAEIVTLVDEYGSEVVCNLLLAYGYARTPRPDDADDPTEA